jgi:ubiquinone/menaquinone biosynthesis C-methylase UbiE
VIGFPERIRVSERMDDPDIDPEALRRALRTLARCNRFLGGTRAVLRSFDDVWAGSSPNQRVVIADVGTGSADLPRALAARAAEHDVRVEVVAVDLHPRTVLEAQAGVAAPPKAEPGLELVRGDARRLPLGDASVDYAMSSQLLHHLSDDDAVRLLSELDRVARAGVFVHDAARRVRAWLWIRALTLLFGDPVTRFDGPASVRQAYLPSEAEHLARRAGWHDVHVRHHFGHRFELRRGPGPSPERGR